MKYFYQNINPETTTDDLLKDQFKTMRPVYICFCNPNVGDHYTQPRFVFTECPCADCEQIARSMDHDISNEVFTIALTQKSIQYIFDNTQEKELHAKIPQERIDAFTECAIVYGSTDMTWHKIVDTYDDLHPNNKFSASNLENYFLQLAFLITFPEET